MSVPTKQVQTLVNKAASVAQALAQLNSDVQALKALYVAANVNVSGTILQGNLAMLNAWLADINAAATDPAVSWLEANKVDSYRGGAFDG